jgi:hypothetical protein
MACRQAWTGDSSGSLSQPSSQNCGPASPNLKLEGILRP